ncbi:MAG: hypothetical protein KDK78_08245, partial [Chlamydiia bacterium]|nr:hypothetical protein [Chlamydiia bacterium]
GHSMGGMVASYFNEFLAAQGHATDVITLGSPLQGTTMFDYGIGEAANDMEWQGPFATALVEKMRENRHGVRYYHIAFRNDNLVVPFEAALTGADPSREIVLDDVGHLSTLFSRCVAEIIVTWLAELHSPLEGRNLCQIDLGSPAPDTRCAVQ